MVETVKSFFYSNHMLWELNTTNVVLVPKVRKSEKVSHFKPISCCNFFYKIISKVMVNGLKPVMEELITQKLKCFCTEKTDTRQHYYSKLRFSSYEVEEEGKEV